MTSYQSYLHQQALKIATQFRQTESDLINILQKIDSERVYLQLKYPSLFAYATQELKLSESVAHGFILVARKSKQIPELKAAIDQGEITMSKAQRVVSVITPENKTELLTLAKTLPKRALEREVAKMNPKLATPEKARYVTEERLELKLGVSEQLMVKLKRIQDILSSRKLRHVTLEEVLDGMTAEYLEHHDPVEKAKRAEAKKVELCPGKVDESNGQKQPIPAISKLELAAASSRVRAAIPAQIKHAIVLKDQGRCSYVDRQGRRCEQQRWLHMHHQIPKAVGGGDQPENLTLLCSGHHRAVHL